MTPKQPWKKVYEGMKFGNVEWSQELACKFLCHPLEVTWEHVDRTTWQNWAMTIYTLAEHKYPTERGPAFVAELRKQYERWWVWAEQTTPPGWGVERDMGRDTDNG